MRCLVCEEPIDEEAEDFEFATIDLGMESMDLIAFEEAGVVCIDCANDLPNTLIYRGRVVIRVEFSEKVYRYMFLDEEALDDMSEEAFKTLMLQLEEIMKLYRWKATDAWRGHYEPESNEAGDFVRVIEGWNDAFKDSDYTIRVKSLREAVLEHIMVFPRSSNLCVVYYDVWCYKGFADRVRRWVLGNKSDDFDFSQGVYIKAI